MKFAIKKVRICVSVAALLAVELLSGCTKAIQQDEAQVTMMRFEGLNNLRYCKVFLIGGNPITKGLRVAVYNMTALNDAGHLARLHAALDPRRQLDESGSRKLGFPSESE